MRQPMLTALSGLLVVTAACAYERTVGGKKIGVDTTDNGHRFVLTQVVKEGTEETARTCLEPYSLAEVTASIEATLKVPNIAEGSSKYAESVTQLLTVGQSMQFLHASLYRLCEAYMNGALDKGEYLTSYDYALRRGSFLLAQEMKTKLADAIDKLAESKKAVPDAGPGISSREYITFLQQHSDATTKQINALNATLQSQIDMEKASDAAFDALLKAKAKGASGSGSAPQPTPAPSPSH
jgi:hypothetical protein